MNHTEALEKAMEWASENHSADSLHHRCAFANSVAYLVTGWSGGFGGPSMREHLVSWSLALLGDLPRSGDWDFDKAVTHAARYCFEPAANYRRELLLILEGENCFDDDPEDIEYLKGKVCLVCGKLLAKQAKGDYCKKHRNRAPSRIRQSQRLNKKRKR